MTFPVQLDFTRGELHPLMHSRIDLEYYKKGLKQATNWTVLRHGGLRKRAGFKFVMETKNNTKKSRLIPFRFSTQQAYALEFGEGYIRKYLQGAILTRNKQTPTAITNANPCVVTIAGHGWVDGARIYGTALGMPELNNQEFTVAGATANTFQLSGINSTSYSAFTGGGQFGEIVETSSAYDEDELFGIDYAQTNDVMTLVYPTRFPKELIRNSATSWSLDNITFRDGPYLDEPSRNANGVKPSITGAIHPIMTSNSLPSGTASNSDADADAYEVFDTDKATNSNINSSNGDWEFVPTAPAVCNNYWIRAPGEEVGRAPASWTFQGHDGSGWVDLDERSGEKSWGGGEVRFFTFSNAVAYQRYRLNCVGTNGSGSLEISGTGWGYNGDFAPTMTIEFDNTDGINGGDGFDANDVGRNIRFLGSDGKWRWFIVETVNSTTEVAGRMYGFALPNKSKLYHWQLGAWRIGDWPSRVQFYEARRAFANTASEVSTIWLSKAFDFYDMGTSQPLVEDDGLRLRILSNEVNAISWMLEFERLGIGTEGGVRVLGKANSNQGFGATNFDMLPNVFTRAKALKPVRVGSVALFASYYGQTIHELVYSLEQDGYIAPNVAILGEHFLKSGIIEIAYQENPDSIVWIVTDDGDLIALTYEREQKIVALTKIKIAGGDTGTAAQVESVCCIPGTKSDEVWIIVKRTLNGVVKRYVEVKAEDFDMAAGDDVEDCTYLDSSLRYEGTATNEVFGFHHLKNLSIDVLADGKVYRERPVSSVGRVSLPGGITAERWCGGLPYVATGITLGLNEAGQRDGAHIGRRKVLNRVVASVYETLSLKMKGIGSINSYNAIRRRASDPFDGPMVPRTENIDVRFDNSWRDDGSFEFFSDDPLPCTIRAFELNVTGEP